MHDLSTFEKCICLYTQLNCSNVCTTDDDDDDVKRDASFRYVRKVETLALMFNTIFIAKEL